MVKYSIIFLIGCNSQFFVSLTYSYVGQTSRILKARIIKEITQKPLQLEHDNIQLLLYIDEFLHGFD